jgi:RNA polymerase sigma-70 factor (sigma-E family)
MKSTDEAEFTELVNAKGMALRRTAYLMCGDWHLAEDAVQTVFVKVHLSWHRIRRHDNVDAFLRTTLFRVVIDNRRRKWRRESAAEFLPDTPSPDTAPHDDRDVLVRALRTLPPRQRAAVVLRFWEDMSVEETAGLMGCAVGTVKSQTSKGLAALRVAYIHQTMGSDRT